MVYFIFFKIDIAYGDTMKTTIVENLNKFFILFFEH